MHLGDRGQGLRSLFVWAAATALLVACVHALGPHLQDAVAAARGSATPRLDAALSDLAAVALVGCLVWGWLATTVVVLEVIGGARPRGISAAVVPTAFRRGVLAACGVALAGGLAAPSYADTGGPHPPGVHAVAGSDALRGLPYPDRVAGREHRDGPPGPSPSTAEHSVVVRPGDSLWDLAARGLPAGSSAADVTRRWHEIYAANRSRIGPDPDLLVPGLHLRLPGKEPS